MRRRISLLTAVVGTGLLLAAGAQAQTTERVSVASDGTQGNKISYELAISADGRFVAFSSASSILVAGHTIEIRDIFVHDRDTGVTETARAPAPSPAEALRRPRTSKAGRTVDGETLEGCVFVSQGQRVIDVLNLDNRVVAFEHADGAIEIFNKAVIGRLKPLEGAVETARQFAA